jgi:predicted nucleotidyltransferase
MTLAKPSYLPKPLPVFCQRWRISELALFGSVLRDDFQPDSDLDILVTFAPDADWGLLDHVRMENELVAIVGREVDPLTGRSVERSHNWIRRQQILDTAQVVYQT